MKYFLVWLGLYFLYEYAHTQWMVPKCPPQYQMNLSTLVMPCNESGYFNDDSVKKLAKFGIVSIDWSNDKHCEISPHFPENLSIFKLVFEHVNRFHFNSFFCMLIVWWLLYFVRFRLNCNIHIYDVKYRQCIIFQAVSHWKTTISTLISQTVSQSFSDGHGKQKHLILLIQVVCFIFNRRIENDGLVCCINNWKRWSHLLHWFVLKCQWCGLFYVNVLHINIWSIHITAHKIPNYQN